MGSHQLINARPTALRLRPFDLRTHRALVLALTQVMQPRLAADFTTNERDGGGGLATEGAVSADDAAGRHGEGGGVWQGFARL